MAALLASVGDVFTAALGWAGTVGSTITSTPVLVLCAVGLPLVGYGIRMFKGMLSTRA